MASVGGLSKVLGIVGVIIMLVTSILLWVYGAKLKKSEDITNKPTTGNVFIAFGVMNIVFGLLMLLVMLTGCKAYKAYGEIEA